MSIHENNQYINLESASMKLTLNKKTLIVKVNTGEALWETVNDTATLSIRAGSEGSVDIPLSAARQKQFEPFVSGYLEGVTIRLSQFPTSQYASDVQVTVALLLNTLDGEVTFEVHDEQGNNLFIHEMSWPGSFGFEQGRDTDYTVVPAMQGYMIPADWQQPYLRYHGGMMFGRDAYMPWWGQVKQGKGYLAIIDTPDDARLSVEHIPFVHTSTKVVWLHSHERIRYSRRLRIRFRNVLDYVAMAKMYRAHVRSLGKLRTLTQKQAENPKLIGLFGAAIVHTIVHTRIAPESYYYNKSNPENNDYAIPFEERAVQLRELNKRYGGKIYAHLDGWGLRGYDNLHPDILPPSPKGGGWQGMLKLQQVCREQKILLALHDNYRDYYHDASSYNPKLTIKDQEGKQEFSDYWAGGAHSWLCTSLSIDYVKRNYDTLKENGVEPDGAYIDVFAVVPGDECYDPTHRMTRSECLAYRSACFEEIRSRGMIVSSEEPADWAVPHLDLVHHAPYALYPDPGRGAAIGVPIPLFSLVYHDAIVVPWSLERGAWGIPETDLGFLHGLLNIGVPYLSIQPSDDEITIVRTMAELHELAGCTEMISHHFLGNNRRRQRSTFADGTIVEIDLDKDAFTITTSDGKIVSERVHQREEEC